MGTADIQKAEPFAFWSLNSLGANLLDPIISIVLGLAAYTLGSVPTAYILVRLALGRDIRELGSKNVGALNTYRQVGLWGGALVLLADAAKGVLAVAVPRLVGAEDWTIFVTTPLVVAGHNWPVFLGFRGGKGAASILGISLVLVPGLTLIAAAPALLAMLLLRNVVSGAAVGFVALNSLLIGTGQSPEQISLCFFLTAVVSVTYLVSVRGRVTHSIKTRQWRELFMELSG